MRKPNFFIVGAPKCGTTAMSEYLNSHPQIFFSPIKEPRYFNAEGETYRPVRSAEQYIHLFRGATASHIAVGEGSVSYLRSSVAIGNIKEFNPRARLIVMLRNPIDMLYSGHSHRVRNREETESDFEAAWRLQAQGDYQCPPEEGRVRWGRRNPQYRQIGRLGYYVEELLDVFPRTQVHFVLFDDFTASTKQSYEDVLAFLGVPSDGRTLFPRVNTSRRYRWEWLARLTNPSCEPVERVAFAVKRMLGLQGYPLLAPLRRANTRALRRKPLRPEFRRELVDEFRADVEKLSHILGRDLQHWMSVDRP